MDSIHFDYTNVLNYITKEELDKYVDVVKQNHIKLHSKSGEGAEFTDWVDYAQTYDKVEFENVKKTANQINEKAEVLVVLGIGGSYLGARAVIEALTPTFTKTNSKTKIYFAGNNMSSKYIRDLIEEIKDKEICINVISKSGTTLETSISFRIFKQFLENKYGKEESKNRIFVTTDKQKGVLKEIADSEGYVTFTVPDGICGRFSVLSSVGLLPIAVAGVSIDELMAGASDMEKILNNENIYENSAYMHAVIRNILYQKGKKIEIMSNYEPTLSYFTKWCTQLFNESEGKEGKGIYFSTVDNTTDLHSIGQYIQESERIIFETVLNIEEDDYPYVITPYDIQDNLQYIEGKTLDYINKKAMEGTIAAHVDGGVPNMIVNIPKMNAYYMGELIYYFEKVCAMSGYILGINPFNQPGVEEYKKNMFRLLGKNN